jgi:Gig2-like
MSTTSANEGTLQVVPNVKTVTAYIILRPFFRPRQSRGELGGDEDKFLAAENWVLDLESTDFPGSVPGRGIYLRYFHQRIESV